MKPVELLHQTGHKVERICLLVINLAIMRSKPKHYTLEFKQKAVELSYAKGNVKQVCEDLDIFPSVLYRWRKELKDYGKNSFPGRGKPKMTDEEKEISRLKKALKEAELERDILKKAIGIFSVSDKKNTGL